jgi:hypothetical protein
LISGRGGANCRNGLANALGSARSSEGASSGTMQRDSGRASGGKSDMKSTQSEQASMGAEQNWRAEDQKKGGNNMKVEGKEAAVA